MDRMIQNLRSGKKLYFLDAQVSAGDFALPEWHWCPMLTTEDIYEYLFYFLRSGVWEVSQIRIQSEDELDQVIDDGLTKREHEFGTRYQEIHEQILNEAMKNKGGDD